MSVSTHNNFWERRGERLKNKEVLENLVSHYSAIGDAILRDAPYSAIGSRGKLFLRCPPSKACLWTAIGQFYGKKWGCSSDGLRYHRKHSATGVLLRLSRDGVVSIGSLRLKREGNQKKARQRRWREMHTICLSWCFWPCELRQIRATLTMSQSQDTFDHDKGQKSAIWGRLLHWIL